LGILDSKKRKDYGHRENNRNRYTQQDSKSGSDIEDDDKQFNFEGFNIRGGLNKTHNQFKPNYNPIPYGNRQYNYRP
jgi:hypothetical protein